MGVQDHGCPGPWVPRISMGPRTSALFTGTLGHRPFKFGAKASLGLHFSLGSYWVCMYMFLMGPMLESSLEMWQNVVRSSAQAAEAT